MTENEKNEIIAAVLAQLRQDSKEISQLTPVTEVGDADAFEVSGGRKVEFANMRDQIIATLTSAVNSSVAAKLDKSAVKQATGTSTTDVMSQKAVSDELEELEEALNELNSDMTGDIAQLADTLRAEIAQAKSDTQMYADNGVQALDAVKIDKSSIVQTTGGAEDKVMSQKAATETYGSVEDNPEYIKAITDADGRLLEAITTEGRKWLAMPSNQDVQLHAELDQRLNQVEGKTEELGHADIPEYLDVTIDSDGKIIEGIKEDGTIYFPNKIQHGEARSEIVDSAEYREVTTDAEGRVIEAITPEGGVFLAKPSNQDMVIQNQVSSQQERLADIENRILSGLTVDIDGKGDFTKISDAIDYANEHRNTVIIINPGTYDLVAELGDDYFSEMQDIYYQGLRLGNGIVLKAAGNGVRIVARYTGENFFVGSQFSIFNIVGDCTVQGIDFVGENIRYIIHDDPGNKREESANTIVSFKYCTFNHMGSSMFDTSQSRPISVGGGVHHNSIHIYDSCRFITTNAMSSHDIAYHSQSECNAKVILKNNYFADGKTFGSRIMGSATGNIELFLCNNRFGAPYDIEDTEYITYTSFNNEYHNQ